MQAVDAACKSADTAVHTQTNKELKQADKERHGRRHTPAAHVESLTQTWWQAVDADGQRTSGLVYADWSAKTKLEVLPTSIVS